MSKIAIGYWLIFLIWLKVEKFYPQSRVKNLTTLPIKYGAIFLMRPVTHPTKESIYFIVCSYNLPKSTL